MKNKSLLMIPGPIEFGDEVLAQMSKPTGSHVSTEFIDTFGQAIERTRRVFCCPQGQPFIIAGSGTLAMDLAAANLIEPGDNVLVINTGYFGDRFSSILERYGANVTQLRAEIGHRPEIAEVETALKSNHYKLMTVTHVDTSTGVLNDVKALSALGNKYQTLVVVDGVCSVAGEELQMQEWGVDIAFTASQKAVSVPPGLALLVAGPKAIEVFQSRKSPVSNYYADWQNWLPIMKAYENRQAAYFGTPAVNLIRALNTSLGQILEEGLENRFIRHKRISAACKSALSVLGLIEVPANPKVSANTMSTPYYPENISGAEFLKYVAEEGVVLAGGLHPQIKTRYFRIGHMGNVDIGDLLKTIAAIELGLQKSGLVFAIGSGVSTALSTYAQ